MSAWDHLRALTRHLVARLEGLLPADLFDIFLEDD